MEPNYNYDYEENAPPHRQRPSANANHPPQHHQQTQTQHHHASNADLLNSAKYLAGSASSAFNRNSSNKVDTGRAAGAAADLLDAASHYARFEEKSFGKYVDQVEDYLHKYQSSHSTTAGTGHAPTSAGAAPHNSSSFGHAPPRKNEEDDSGSGGGGYGDYIKMAQGFLKKY